MSLPDIGSLSFEAAMAELEALVQKLESGAASLDESIALYERGAALRAHCAGQLEAAQMRVEQIVAKADGISLAPADIKTDE